MFGKRKDDEQMIGIIVDDTERRIIVRALADLRDKQRMEHKNPDCQGLRCTSHTDKKRL